MTTRWIWHLCGLAAGLFVILFWLSVLTPLGGGFRYSATFFLVAIVLAVLLALVAAMSSKAAILRVAPAVREKLSRANALYFDRTLDVIGQDGQAVLAGVLKALYPHQNRDSALTSFRQFRAKLALAAKEAGVRLSLETDGQTRSKPEDRVVWFEAEDRITEEVKRMVDSEIGDVERTPQDVEVAPPVRFFVSYAHKDSGLKDKLLEKLTTYLGTHPQMHFEIWTDAEILPGKEWRVEIRKAMAI